MIPGIVAGQMRLGGGGTPVTFDPSTLGPGIALSNGSLTATRGPDATTHAQAKGAVVLTGQRYWEISVDQTAGTNGFRHNVGVAASAGSSSEYVGQGASSAGYRANGNKVTAGAAAGYGDAFTAGDVIGVAYDADAGAIWFSRNGVWQAGGDPAAGTGAAYTGLAITNPVPAIGEINNAGSGAIVMTGRFSGADWGYSAPAGFSEIA